MQILVTGAYGQLGSEIKELVSNYPDWKFLFTDVDSLDITSVTAVENYFSANKVDVVVNCAAYTAVDKAESDQETAHLVNAIAPKILAKRCRETGAKLIHVSTDYVFAGNACTPYSETDKTDPKGAYGRTKLDGENFVLAENPDAVIIRTSWLYSSFGNNFVKTMLRLGKEKEQLGVVFDQVGTPTYAADLAAAILQIVKKYEIKSSDFIPGIYHYSNEGVASWFDFTLAIFEFSGIKIKVNPVLSDQFPTPTKRPHFSVLNKLKIKNNFDIEIPYWKDSLQVCLNKLQKA
ncbi:dTDP-4-dehydrorhamnose reductase [Maribellus sediminis]|uniref:dTDP-4-dehydrorhamnose reductase n=1 Tax=Maribellus sediminis TaxID=2696285 RepID=UPI001430E2BE|nr:dTDP-4-dehydrorhamnose reductase [Maribellus sediminis]